MSRRNHPPPEIPVSISGVDAGRPVNWPGGFFARDPLRRITQTGSSAHTRGRRPGALTHPAAFAMASRSSFLRRCSGPPCSRLCLMTWTTAAAPETGPGKNFPLRLRRIHRETKFIPGPVLR
jgi:hypothetical protein